MYISRIYRIFYVLQLVFLLDCVSCARPSLSHSLSLSPSPFPSLRACVVQKKKKKVAVKLFSICQIVGGFVCLFWG